ncbi:hypothetical protein CCAX7_35110 [Capsulimonas corticalis]|uniref:Uncharacterized protein n=1 Tax=Capsulimonas corticalis TaxID=2219043 RepID=A0A402CY58_9BACT|nr:hypothetical protein [Capsulimonas corticalis]BDI31460.1 hypothetical protein CCAX7_35110 [Capsulimonas corticalis]
MTTHDPQNISRTLRSPRLSVEIDVPGARYRGSRYDWTSFVRQVTLDGAHTFCGVESPIPGQGDGGVGLCGEFGIFTALDYEAAKPDEKFSKLGVGMLTRIDEARYQFSRPYEIEPAIMASTWTEDSVYLVIEHHDCRGTAARLEKIIRVEDNHLIVASRLVNTGAAILRTEEYAHNYLALDGAPITPDYSLSAPSAIRDMLIAHQAERGSWGATWTVDEKSLLRAKSPAEGAFYLRAAPPNHTAPPLAEAGTYWEITNNTTGLTVRETTDFPWWNFALYGTEHTICPEVFIRLNVSPGQYQSWSRRYTFTD